MQMFGWWKRKKTTKKVDSQSDTKDKDICPDCGGESYCINENHYIADNDYSRRYLPCKRCSGTGRCDSNIDSY